MPLFDSFGSLFFANTSLVNAALYIGVSEVLSGNVSINSTEAAPTPTPAAVPVVQHSASVSPAPCARLPRCKDPCSANTRKSIKRLIASVRRARGVSKTPKAIPPVKVESPKPLSPTKKVPSTIRKLLSIVAKSPAKKASVKKASSVQKTSPMQKLVSLITQRSVSPTTTKKAAVSPKKQLQKLHMAIRNLRSVSPVIKVKPKSIPPVVAAAPCAGPMPAKLVTLLPQHKALVRSPSVQRDTAKLIAHIRNSAPKEVINRDLNRLARDFGLNMNIQL